MTESGQSPNLDTHRETVDYVICALGPVYGHAEDGTPLRVWSILGGWPTDAEAQARLWTYRVLRRTTTHSVTYDEI